MTKPTRVTLTTQQNYWLKHVQACTASGKTIAEYAKNHGLRAKTMYAGKKTLAKKGVLPRTQAPRFQRAQVVESVADNEWRIQLPNGVTVAFVGSVDAGALSTVLNTAATVE
jgi:hypothetical protein